MLQIPRFLRVNQRQSGAKRSKNRTSCANEVKTSERKGEAGTVTSSRLHEFGNCLDADQKVGPALPSGSAAG
jgi:hypothetical protein